MTRTSVAEAGPRAVEPVGGVSRARSPSGEPQVVIKPGAADWLKASSRERRRSVTVVVPAYGEVENLAALIERVGRVRAAWRERLDLDLLIMNDDSGDGSDTLVERLGRSWVRLVTRRGERGLSRAVLEGLRMARGSICVVMDADLSHPPERIPELAAKVAAGHDFVIGSRYAPGGTTEERWGLLRSINSKAATLLARPLTPLRDPMAGFFALPRSLLDHAGPLNPVGYKIGLELLVKGGCTNPAEVPIHFTDRRHGQSKLTLAEQLRYLRHLRRLFVFKYPNRACFLQFALVGAVGTGVNLAVLTLLLAIGLPFVAASAAAVFVSLVGNFALNRRFTFSYARDGPILYQFIGFAGACSIGAAVNYAASLATFYLVPSITIPQLAACLGILAGMGVNYAMNRLFVFRMQCPPPDAAARMTGRPRLGSKRPRGILKNAARVLWHRRSDSNSPARGRG